MIALFLTAVLLHPVHETLSEMEWNNKSKRLEVALRMHSLDEQWLRKQHSQERPHSTWATDYVRKHFRISPLPKKGKQEANKYSWIGRQTDGAHVWWYFEIESPSKLPPNWIQQTTLLEREENYTNRVLLLHENPKRSLSLTKKHPSQSLVREDEAPPEP